MPIGENDSQSHVTSVPGSEYIAGSSARHRSIGGTRRVLFFSLASIWGFIVGVVGLLAAMSAAGQPVQPSGAAMPGLMFAFVLAAAGGVVVAAAYRESKRRAR